MNDMTKIMRIQILAAAFCGLMTVPLMAAEKIEAEKAAPIGKAATFADPRASGGKVVKALGDPGSGLRFDKVPAAKKLAIHYASKTEMGTYSIQVNDQQPVKVNFHSTGAADSYYTYAIIDLDIPAGATLKLQNEQGDTDWSVDYILIGNDSLGLKPDIWNLPRFVPAPGKFLPDWKSLNQYQAPEWFREAKFGIWNHFTPEVVPEEGDWYFCDMYGGREDKSRFNDHLKRYGHPSEHGFIEFLDQWKCKAWDPSKLMKTFSDAGAKYFVQLANHHDNFDNWNSKYQPFNSVNFGPKKDLVGLMAAEARKSGLRFGVSYHAVPTFTWLLFMPSSYGSDATGDKAGVPYDGRALSLANSAGKFWAGYDPKDFYGPVHAGTTTGAFNGREPADPNSDLFFRQFLARQDDVLKYQPDLLYFDTGLVPDGFGIPESGKMIIANFYNKSMAWNKGKLDAVVNFKYPDGHEKALVSDYEVSSAASIQAYPWQTDTMISNWSYHTSYPPDKDDGTRIIKMLASNVARNGNLLINLPLRADGSLDAATVTICEGIGAWMKVNGEAIYGSRPFEKDHESETFFTRRGGFIYATTFSWPIGGKLILESLHQWGRTIGKVQKVEILGGGPVNFTQDGKALTIDCTTKQPEMFGGIRAFVFKITQDKVWVNDDDPNVKYAGWDHTCNTDTAEYNNDLHSTKTAGAVCEYPFTGSGIELIGTKSASFGSIGVSIDGAAPETVSLATPPLQTQAVMFAKTGLAQGPHVIRIVNQGEAPVNIDAFHVIP
jgi:alpha-L-fucosidase